MSPHEFQREAKIIARRLVKQRAWLENIADLANKSNWVIVTEKMARKSKATSVATEVVEEMRSACWLISDPTGSLKLSAAGAEKLLNLDDGERFFTQHQNRQQRVIKDVEGRTVSVQFNETESPLGWMRARKDKSGKRLLNLQQFEAGERIRRDFTMAQMSPRVTASWEFSAPGGSKKMRRGEGAMEISEQAMAAKQRLCAALDCLGTEMSGVVFEVCCLASGLESAERQFNWPRRSAKLVLQIALTKLSEHYGFAQPATSERSGLIRQWGREGYQPVVPPSQSQ